MTIYVPGKLTLRQSWQPMDPDAAAYITNVEAADGQPLEEKVKIAIDNFVLGCKADGIWNAIKASCILAGARTLAGALVPLAGATGPTSFNFVAGDYNRETGLKGNGSTKYLDSNRSASADPLSNTHMALYQREVSVNLAYPIGAATTSPTFQKFGNYNTFPNSWRIGGRQIGSPAYNGFVGASSTSTELTARSLGANTSSSSLINQSAQNINIYVFAVNLAGSPSGYINSRLSFYSIGESLDLALLDTRVTDLMTALGAAIP
jgi:hypothetical protein